MWMVVGSICVNFVNIIARCNVSKYVEDVVVAAVSVNVMKC